MGAPDTRATRLALEVGAEPPADRVRAWKHLLRENFIGVDCRTDAETLRGSIAGRVSKAGSISCSSISRQTLYRTSSLINQEKDETAVIALVTKGVFGIDLGTRSSALKCGDLCILDDSRPFEAHFASDMVEHVILHVPKNAVTRRAGDADERVFKTFGAENPLQNLVTTFLRNVALSLDAFDDEMLARLLDQSLDLLALMIDHGRPGSVDPSTHRAGMLLRAKSYIAAHLKSENLTIDHAARAIGISPRYLNALLAEEKTSFGRYVLRQRLEGARREIMDPRRANKQVSEVAFQWGFNNVSHFGRVFKDRYGMAPRDAKMTRMRA